MVVELGTEAREAIVAVFVALRSWWPRRAGAWVKSCAIRNKASRTLGQLSIERFLEMPGSWTFWTVRCTLHRDVFILCQVDIDRSWGCWTSAYASFGLWMGSHVVRAGVYIPAKNKC